MLTDAWKLYAKCDFNARYQQANFRRYQATLLLLGLIGTFLALLQTTISKDQALLSKTLHFAIVVVTATASGLLTVLNRHRPGEKWLLLRSCAQAVKREIYRYRMKVEDYRNETGQTLLYHKLNEIAKGLDAVIMREYEGPIPPVHGADTTQDDGVSPLGPDQYVEFRIADQFAYYRSRIATLNQQAQILNGISILASVVGTILAVLDFTIWVPFTTAITLACVSYLQQRQVETTLSQYNQSYNSLVRLESWWRNELSEQERTDPAIVEKLVSSTEEILDAELTNWTQKLNEAVAKLETAAMSKDHELPSYAIAPKLPSSGSETVKH